MEVLNYSEVEAVGGGAITTGAQLAGTVILAGTAGMVGGLIGGPAGAVFGAKAAWLYMEFICE